MVNNSNPASFLANILQNAESFVKAVEKGDFLTGIPEENRKEAMKEYKKQIKASGIPDMLKDLKGKVAETKDISKKMNNA